jgi:hypothetical protein
MRDKIRTTCFHTPRRVAKARAMKKSAALSLGNLFNRQARSAFDVVSWSLLEPLDQTFQVKVFLV